MSELPYETAEALLEDLLEHRAKKLGYTADTWTIEDWKAFALSQAKVMLTTLKSFQLIADSLPPALDELSRLRARKVGRPRKPKRPTSGIWIPPGLKRTGRRPSLESLIAKIESRSAKRGRGRPASVDYHGIVALVDGYKSSPTEADAATLRTIASLLIEKGASWSEAEALRKKLTKQLSRGRALAKESQKSVKHPK